MKRPFFIFLLCAGAVASCNQNHETAQTQPKDQTSQEVCSTTIESSTDKHAANIQDSIALLYNYDKSPDATYRYTFLEFGSVGCAPCKKMEKEMEIIRKEFAGTVNVRFINLSQKWSRDWATHFNIKTIPTQVVLDSKGSEIYRHTGYIPADELKKVFK